MAITRSKPQLPPFTRLVHLGIAVSFLLALFAAGRELGLHRGAGLSLAVLLLIWIVLMSFGLTSKRGAPPKLPTRLLWLLLLAVLLLTVVAGIGTYSMVYGGGPVAGWLAAYPELGQWLLTLHRPLALVALVLAAIHAFSAGWAKFKERRQRLR